MKRSIPSARELAAALGAHSIGRGQFMAKCPAHQERTGSLSIKDGHSGPLVYCFGGCSQDAVIQALVDRGLWPQREERSRETPRPSRPSRPPSQPANLSPDLDRARRIGYVRHIWREAKDPRGTRVTEYLAHRGLPPLSDEQAETVFRFHPNCPFANEHVPCLIARFAPIVHDDGGEPAAIARIRLDRFEGKDRRLSLGPAAGQVVKLSDDADVTLGLGIAEGIEKGLALLASGWAPMWATIGTSTMRTFPVLAGIEGLTIFCDRDDPGRDAALSCSRRWRDAGCEARILQPPAPFKDWDAWWKAGAP